MPSPELHLSPPRVAGTSHTLDEARRRLPHTLAFSPGGTAMLEQYLDGVELNGLLAVRDGQPMLLTLSDRLRPHGPGFGIGWIHSFPSSLPEPVLDRARDVSFAAVRALGLRNGIAFPQLIVDRHGAVRIVEVAARIASGQMADLVRLGTGIDLFEIATAQALGRLVADSLVTARSTRPIAIRFLTARPGVLPIGTVTAIDRLDRLRASLGVLAADLYFDVRLNDPAAPGRRRPQRLRHRDRAHPRPGTRTRRPRRPRTRRADQPRHG